MKGDLSGKSVVITGATSGIGLAAVKAFVAAGAFVIGVGRNAQRNRKALESVFNEVPESHVRYLLADLAVQDQVHQLAITIKEVLKAQQINKLDVLVNNAGVYQERKHKTVDGIEMTFAVNHLAPYMLTHDLKPLLQASEDGRVLTVSSYAHYTTPLCLDRIANPWPYIGLLAYKRSKLCNVLFTYELNRREKRLKAYAVDPGLVNTGIASKGGKGISDWVWRWRREKGTDPVVPVRTLLYLAGEKAELPQGYYVRDCQSLEPSKNAQNAKLGDKLWRLSGKLTGVNW